MRTRVWGIRIMLLYAAALAYVSCRPDPPIVHTDADIGRIQQYVHIPAEPYDYASPELPAFYADQFISIQDNTPAGNQITDWGATLGRVLFYDTRLSMNYTTACASCHQQQFGFTDTAKLSKGFHGGFTKRHSMSLLNARYYISGRFFWDERAATLEEQVLKPIQDTVEMGMPLDTLARRLRQTPYYPALFRYAFGDTAINSERISRALAQFVRSMVSYQSKYDEGRALVSNRLDAFPNFTAEENLGKTIFMAHPKINCSGCHSTDAFFLDNPRNNGLSATNDDAGIFIHTLNNQDMGKFKAPSLKNIALRINYMHDGSLRGLGAVIAHYNGNISSNPNLDPHLKDTGSGQPLTMNLTASEAKALEAFLKTLTDTRITTDPKYSSPF